MHVLLHLVFLCLYAGLAVGLALFGPQWVPWLDQVTAYFLGALALLGGGLLHEIYARTGRAIDHGRQLLSLGYDVDDQREEIETLHREVATLREALDSAVNAGNLGPNGRTIEEVMAEVKVLKSLMPRLEAKSTGPDKGGLARENGRMPPMAGDMDAERILDVVRASLRDDRVDLVLQPIVSLPQRKRRFYECFSRLRTGDGAMILPEQYVALAERAGLITAIDNMLLFRCVQLVRKVHRTKENVDFFCNISPHTLTDSDFFGDFVEFLESNEELAPHLIFEFGQTDFARWSEAGAGLLDRLAHLGCRFSLDRIIDLNLDPPALAERQIRFVKVEIGRLLTGAQLDHGLLRALRRHRIDLIVEKIEDENRLIELLDYEIDFGQGYLFGAPRLARPAA
jgi:cyclic-di-GMP phosphodiesterase, flagellum assembly factor TipF